MNSFVQPPAGAGVLLQRARIAQGKSLAEVAAATRVATHRLASLERGELDGRNERVFAIGYIRGYARALGLDPAPFEAAFHAQHQPPPKVEEPPPKAKPASPPWRSWRVWLVLCLALTGAGLQLAPDGFTRAADWLQIASRWMPVAGNAPHYMALTLPGPYNIEDYLPEQQRVPAAPGGGDAQLPLAELRIAVSGPCWVDITDAKRRRLVAQLLQSGDNLALLGEPPFDVRLGNPAVAVLTYAGERVPLPTQVGGRLVRLSVGESRMATAAEP